MDQQAILIPEDTEKERERGSVLGHERERKGGGEREREREREPEARKFVFPERMKGATVYLDWSGPNDDDVIWVKKSL
jgi:hypothetical protein